MKKDKIVLVGDNETGMTVVTQSTTKNYLKPIIYTVINVKDDSGMKVCKLVETELSIKLPKKVYGKDSEILDRLMRSYEKSKTGVSLLAVGSKGNGKTLLVNIMAKALQDKYKLPIINIKTVENMDSLIDLLTKLGSAILYLDEFTRNIGWSEQDKLLTLLSGLEADKRIGLFTSNHLNQINDFMLDRPERIKYIKYYLTIPEDVVTEYLDDNLKHKQFKDDIIKAVQSSPDFNMDSLITIVDEINTFYTKGKTFEQIISVLNIAVKLQDRFTLVEVESKDGYKMNNTRLKELNYGNFELSGVLALNEGALERLTVRFGTGTFIDYTDGLYHYSARHKIFKDGRHIDYEFIIKLKENSNGSKGAKPIR